MPSFPKEVLGNPKNGGTTYQWVVQKTLKNYMKVQNVLISINFMVLSVFFADRDGTVSDRSLFLQFYILFTE